MSPGRQPRLGFALAALCLAFTRPMAAEDFVTNVVSGIFTNAGGAYHIGSTGSSNHLSIIAGGWLENTAGILGNDPAANHNSAVVQDPGSLWENTSALYVGRFGSFNSVGLSGAAELTASVTYVGFDASSSSNTVHLQGSDTRWTSSGGFILGNNGSGNHLRILDGARLSSGGHGKVGNTTNSHHNTALIDGPNAIWAGSTWLDVGGFGSRSNTLTISRGGILGCTTGTIGNGSGNRVFISDPGSRWTCSGSVLIGEFNRDNHLSVMNGATVSSVSAFLSGDSNSVLLADAGTVWTTGGAVSQFVIGQEGEGNTMIITNGARLVSEFSFVIGDEGRIHLTGAGSEWEARQTLTFGQEFAEHNLVTVDDGARIVANELSLAGDRGEVNLSGINSDILVTNELYVGHEAGAGNILRILDGARVASRDAYVSGTESPFSPHTRNRTNAVYLSDAGSTWNIDGNLHVGSTGGDSVFQLENGAQADADDIYLGFFNTSKANRAVVSGSGSLLTGRGDLYVGHRGADNTLHVTNQGTVLNINGAVGWHRNDNNTAWVAGAGSVWHNQGRLTIGGEGSNNRLMIRDGGRVVSGVGFIGLAPGFTLSGKSNAVVVAGAGSAWTNHADLNIGRLDSFNSLTVSNQARVDAADMVVGNAAQSFNNALVVRHNGEVALWEHGGSGLARLDLLQASLFLDDGIIRAGELNIAGDASHPADFPAGLLQVRSGSTVSNMKPFVVGDGSRLARLELCGGSHSFADGLHIAAGSVLDAEGTLSGSVTNEGRLVVGAPKGTLSIAPDLHLGDASETVIEIGGPPGGGSFISVAQQVRLAGTLRLRLVGGYIPYETTEIPLMKFNSSSGELANVVDGIRLTVEGTSNSFRIDISGSQIVATGFEGPDALPDSDGIDDAWALQFFGHSPLSDAEKAGDPDNDGASTYEEFVANTHPFEGSSVFRIISLNQVPGGDSVVRFYCAPDRSYRIHYTDDLSSWQMVTNPVLQNISTNICEWTDGAVVSPRRVYRVEVYLP